MNNQMNYSSALNANVFNAGFESAQVINEFFNSLIALVCLPFRWITAYYESVLEREVSTSLSVKLTCTQLFLVAGIFPADYSLSLRMVFCIGFLAMLRYCAKSL